MWKFQLFKNRKIVSERRSRTHWIALFWHIIVEIFGAEKLLPAAEGAFIVIDCCCLLAGCCCFCYRFRKERQRRAERTHQFRLCRGKTSFPIAKEYPSKVAQCDRSLQTGTARLWLGRGQRTTWAGIVTIVRNPAVSSVILCVSARSRPVSPLRCGTPS